MRYQLILAGVTALATSVAALPHVNEHAHAHAHARRQATVVKVVTVTVPAANAAPSVDNKVVNPNFEGLEKVGDPDGPGGFTPRVTATGASVVTLANGDRSVSHLEQTLGLSTAAQVNPTAAAAPNSYGDVPAEEPVRFSSDPSTGGPPIHPFEVIVNEPSQPGANNRDYPGTILLQHNFHRRNQSAPDLIWGFALQRTAQDIANNCVFQHDLTQQNGGYGQSIVAGIPADQIGRVMTDTFYNTQVSQFTGYGEETPDMSNFNNWGFFTQVVWKATQQIGCYSVDCSSKGGLQGKPAGSSDDWTVCNYWPAGNVDGQYAQNVGPVGNMPAMSWDTDSWPPKAP